MAEPSNAPRSKPSSDDYKEALLETMTLLVSQLNDVARTDAVRRSLIDDMTHDSYVTPKGDDRRVQSASDTLINACHRQIVETAKKITILAPTHTKEMYVARPAQDVPTSGDRLTPAAFLEAYELLYVETYGSGAIVQDENHIHGSGKAFRGRTKTNEVETRGGAVSKKKLSASQKNVIKSQRAFNQKTKIDKRLRKMGKEILDYLNREQAQNPGYYMRCSKCKKHAEDEWQFCPRCGANTEKVDKE
jgi:hypothetical protein